MTRFLNVSLMVVLTLGLAVPAPAQEAPGNRGREAAREQERQREARDREASTRAHVEGARRQGEQAYFARNQSLSAGELKRAAEAARGASAAGTVHTGNVSAATNVAPGATPGGNNGSGGVHSRGRRPGS